MDTLSLHYFSELANDLHMTRTAARLFLSQQTLSNHIQRLEEHFGTPLLYRKPALRLTPAGEAVLEFAKHLLREEDDLKRRLSDLSQETRGSIQFGASHLRMQASLPYILTDFSEAFPQVELRLTNANSEQLEPMVLDGSLDFAIVLSNKCEAGSPLVQTHLMEDQIFLCMTASLIKKHYSDSEERIHHAFQGAQVQNFSVLPFCTSSNRVGSILNQCFKEASITAKVYLSDPNLSVSLSACFQGLAACALTKSSLLSYKGNLPDDLCCFPLLYRDMPIFQTLSLIYRRDRYLPKYAKTFRDLLVTVFQTIQQKELFDYV